MHNLKRISPPKRQTTSMQELINDFQSSAAQLSSREKAFRAIESERDYQNDKWGNTLSGGKPGNGNRSVDEFSLYIAGYTEDLVNIASHFGDDERKLHVIRKIAALAVACMEQHGAPNRAGFEKV